MEIDMTLPLIELRGIKDGVEVSLGMVAMPPSMKAREILREYGFNDFEDDTSQDALALWAMESLIDYCQKYYTQPVPADEAQSTTAPS